MPAIPEYPFFRSLKQEEIWRYLGYKNQQPDETICEKISICLEKLLSLAEPRSVYRFFDISFSEGSSHKTADDLSGCSSHQTAGCFSSAPANDVSCEPETDEDALNSPEQTGTAPCKSDRAGDTLFLEGIPIRSRSLARHLKGCHRVCLMAATIGPAPDRL